MASLRDKKQQLRLKIKEIISNTENRILEANQLKIREYCTSLIQELNPNAILYYQPQFRAEINIDNLINQDNTHFPKVKGKQMDFYNNQNQIFEAKQFNQIIAFIPGLAFDNNCNRLGRGGGYYDRFLSECPCIKVGLAHDFQVIQELPTEDHDIQLDYLVTEKKIYSNL